MAEVISFQDVVRQRRRRREQELTEQCVRVIEINLRLAVDLYEAAPAAERPVRARRIRRLGELLEYALALL